MLIVVGAPAGHIAPHDRHAAAVAAQQADEDALDHVGLADDDLADLCQHLVDEGALFADQLIHDSDVALHGGASLHRGKDR